MLNQRQLYVASQLFVAAGKAGAPFELSKFSTDRAYALATLSSLASQLTDPASRAIIAEALQVLSDPAPQVAAVSTTATESNPVTPPQPERSADRYVGRLR